MLGKYVAQNRRRSNGNPIKRVPWGRFIIVFLLVVLLTGNENFSTTFAAQEEWRPAHGQAVNLAREGKFSQALPILKTLEAQNPGVIILVFDRVVILHWSGQDKEALTLFEEKLRGRKDVPNYVKEAVANAYYRSGNFASARVMYRELATAGERRFKIMEAQSLIRLNDPAEADRIYFALLKETPNDPEIYISRGDTRLTNGDSRKAIEDFEAAQTIVKKTEDAEKLKKIDGMLAGAYIRASDSARAIVTLQPYIQKGTADLVMQADYVFALRQNGNYEQAISEAHRLWNDLHKPPVYGVRVLGDAYLRLGSFAQAIQVYAVVLQRDPQDQMALLGTALAKALSGQVGEALQRYDQILANDPRLAEMVLDDCLYFISLGKTWTAQKIFNVITNRIPNNAPFYRQYADRLSLSGLPRAAYKNYQILKGLPGVDPSVGAAGMSRSATATGDYVQARELLDSLDQKQFRSPVVAQALREYEERQKGAWNSNIAVYQDFRNKSSLSGTDSFEVNLGGNISLLGQTTRMSLRNTETGETASYFGYGPGLRLRGMKYDLKAWWQMTNIANMEGHRVSLDYFPNDKSTFNIYAEMMPVDEAGAVNQRIMSRTYGGSYSWRTFAPPVPGETMLREKNNFMVGYSEGNLTDGNKTSGITANWDRVLRDDRFRRLTWSTYLSRQRYAFESPYYYSPELRHAVGTGLVNRTYVKRGYWEWRTFLEFGGAHPYPWDFSPYVRLEYGHFFTSLFYVVAGCEYGFSSRNEAGDPSIGFGHYQCDFNINLLW